MGYKNALERVFHRFDWFALVMLRFGEGFLFVLTRLTFGMNDVYWEHQKLNKL